MTDALFGVTAGGLVAGVVYVLVRLVQNHVRPGVRPPPGVEVAYSSLIGRLEDCEDKYNRLDRRFTRLQGEFNALTRLSVDVEEDDSDKPTG